MRKLRNAPGVEASDRGDPLRLLAVESREGGMDDEVSRVTVMLRPIHGGADIVQQRSAFQQLPIERTRAVKAARAVENRHREARYVRAVGRIRVERCREVDDRPAPGFRKAPRGCRRAGDGAASRPRRPSVGERRSHHDFYSARVVTGRLVRRYLRMNSSQANRPPPARLRGEPADREPGSCLARYPSRKNPMTISSAISTTTATSRTSMRRSRATSSTKTSASWMLCSLRSSAA
jgi:hypothetical protein